MSFKILEYKLVNKQYCSLQILKDCTGFFLTFGYSSGKIKVHQFIYQKSLLQKLSSCTTNYDFGMSILWEFLREITAAGLDVPCLFWLHEWVAPS